MLMAALADDGYLVASFDNSGTPAPKGTHWRKVIYGVGRRAGIRRAGSRVARSGGTHPYVDLTRVGVFGWSGGGSMTLNLMFRHPELYSVGVAGAPVPDQTLYDSIYQERYMGLPPDNAKGYHDGSPISYAEGLQRKAADRSRHRRRQCAFPGHAAAVEQADRAQQAVPLHGVSEPPARRSGF